ncbi:allergen Cr-PI-like [Agrilus planipennis]|uniref:Allergen Cr-PI-like n=1 Tax=Agrilus planipennis TaxID=224129 RepID=A0A1W4WUI0_AGRPL|nr:allergen Cr-PI-like [Agrilus planipennis]
MLFLLSNDWKESKFSNEQAFKQFLQHYQTGLLPRGTQFSVFYYEHLKQAIALFKLLYYAKDYDTFFKTAVWARQNLNEGLFLYSFSVALKHRNDTYKVILPPIYELNPYYFVTGDSIYQVQKFKQLYHGQQLNEPYIIPTNYTSQNVQHSLAYFLEDIGLNAYYYYFNLYYPFWLGGEEFKMKNDRRGELYYFVHQQLLARYYLERLSNHAGDIPILEYDIPAKTGYRPHLVYSSGTPFPSRENPTYLPRKFDYYESKMTFNNYYSVQDLERRIVDAIDAGFVYTEKGEKVDIYTPEGFNILGNIIEGNADSLNSRFYGHLQIFAHQLVVDNHIQPDEYHVVPSVLQHFETSLRDPIYWEFMKRIVVLFQSYKLHLPKYSYHELNFSGVKVENLDVDPLVTLFDYTDYDIAGSVILNPHEFERDPFVILARQTRLNHKPFSYTVNVTSDKEQQAVIRTFIGPKCDQYGQPIDINEHRLNFFQLDTFVTKLNAGVNVFKRDHSQFHFAPDKPTYRTLYNKINNATNEEQLKTSHTEFSYGFPQRFILPKGQRAGQMFQFFVIVTPRKGNLAPDNIYMGGILKVGSGNQYVDSLPLGYPFDRVVDKDAFVSVQNSYFKDVIIYHK